MGRLIIYAPNIHSGGGAVLLRDLIQSLDLTNVILFVDKRFEYSNSNLSRIDVKKSIHARIRAEFILKKTSKNNDIILCFGNLPPMLPLSGSVYLFIQNRYLLDFSRVLKMPFKIAIRLLYEFLWLRMFVHNANRIIVQTESMKKLVVDRFHMKCLVKPFMDASYFKLDLDVSRDGFIYPASADDHKNHRNLILAWGILAESFQVRPKLLLCFEEAHYPEVAEFMRKEVSAKGLNIENRVLGRVDVLEAYSNCNLIFPSTFESFGLPLLEARQCGAGIVASEMDYVRDVVNPDASFDPLSPLSIARAIMRFMYPDQEYLQEVSTAEKFVEDLGSLDSDGSIKAPLIV